MALRPVELIERGVAETDPSESGLIFAQAGLVAGLPKFALQALDAVSDDGKSVLLRMEAFWLADDFGSATTTLLEIERNTELDWATNFLAAKANWMIGDYARALVCAKASLALVRDTDNANDRDCRRLAWFASYLHALTSTPAEMDVFSDRALHGRLKGEVPRDGPVVALLDYKNPDLLSVSANLGDFIQSVAALRHLARFSNVQWTYDEPGLARPMDRLRSTWREDETQAFSGNAHLAIIDRDAPQSLAVRFPDRPVWAIYNGWFSHKAFGKICAMPAPPNLHPIMISFHLWRPEDMTPPVLKWLRGHAPIGCRDKTTMRWLLNQGIDAFFSGCLTMTLAAEQEVAARTGSYDVDASDDAQPGREPLTHQDPSLRTALFSSAIEHAMDRLSLYARAETVRTGRLHCALPCQALGTPVRFEPKNTADRRFDGLIGIEDDVRDRLRADMTGIIAGVLEPILAGASVDLVRKRWTELTGPAVRAAKAEIFPFAAPRLDRVRPAECAELPAGEPVTLAIALDANYLAKASVLLRSIRANTDQPIRLVLLVRGLEDEALEPLSVAADACETRIFHMDERFSGASVELLQKITISTMDRLFLTELLPDLDQVVYVDCDIIVLGDIAELAALKPGSTGIAARPTPNPKVAALVEMSERRASKLPKAQAQALRARLAANNDLMQQGFNAGVLVLSLERLRENGLLDRAQDFVSEFAVHDQDALNFAATDGYAALPARWNSMPQFDYDLAPALIHWVGARKPWMKTVVRYQHYWNYFAKQREPAITKEHWLNADSYQSDWEDRAQLAAKWIAPGSHILDLGAGAPLSLKQHLPKGCRYQGADLRAWTDQVVAVDLDTGDFPAGHFDTVVMLGLVEYLERPGQVFASAGKAAPRLIVSYCHPQPDGDPELRAMRGWINAFSAEKFAQLLYEQEWAITDSKIYRENQNIHQRLYECKRR